MERYDNYLRTEIDESNSHMHFVYKCQECGKEFNVYEMKPRTNLCRECRKKRDEQSQKIARERSYHLACGHVMKILKKGLKDCRSVSVNDEIYINKTDVIRNITENLKQI